MRGLIVGLAFMPVTLTFWVGYHAYNSITSSK